MKNKVTIVLGTIFCFVTILFFWKENLFEWNYPIKDSKVNNYFATFSSIATVLGLYYISKQFQERNKPFLRPDNFDIEIKDDVKSILIITTPNSEIKRYKSIRVVDNNAFKIRNIGSDAAKEISISWKFSKEDVLRFININESIQFKIDDVSGTEKISYVSQNQDFSANKLPVDYLCCFHPEVIKARQNSGELLEYPSLEIEINYQNIHKNVYKSEYYVKILAFSKITDNSHKKDFKHYLKFRFEEKI